MTTRTTPKVATDGPKDLRRRGEARLKSRTADLEKIFPEEAKELLHKLHVHQVEMEMQNDQLRRAQAELKGALTRYTDLYDFAPVAYLTLDKAGLIWGANLLAAHLLGVERSRLLKTPLTSYILPPDRVGLPAGHPPITSFLGVPLRREGRIIGCINLGNKDGGYDQSDLDAAEALSVPIVEALRRRRAEKELARQAQDLAQHNREIGLLHDLGELLQGCHTVAEAYSVIGRSLGRLFAGDSGALFIFRSSRNLVEAVAVWGEAPPPEQVFAPDDCWALRQGKAQLGGEGAGASPCAHVFGGTGAYLCVPLMSHGEAMGLLRVLPASPDEGRLERKQQLTLTGTSQLGLALANLKMQENLRDMAVRDPLTGLFNRRYLEETLEREFLRATRQGAPIPLIMLDIDHFKRFNDTYGHDAGDALLRESGVFLQRHIRGSDVACRYGGEEFVLTLPESSLEIACARAEEMRQAVKTLQVHHGHRTLEAITLSFGVAALPEHGDNLDAVLNAADAAMYRAKQAGRDRVVAANGAAPDSSITPFRL